MHCCRLTPITQLSAFMLLVWRRYHGPHVWDLPVDALRAAPVEWERFLHGGSLQAAYNVPDSTTMLLERLDENVVTYLVRFSSSTSSDTQTPAH